MSRSVDLCDRSLPPAGLRRVSRSEYGRAFYSKGRAWGRLFFIRRLESFQGSLALPDRPGVELHLDGPFADDDVQAVFEHRIEEAIRPGGIILANRKVSQEWRTRGDFELLETDHALHWMIRKTTTPAR